jgi:hypothetical protein
LFTRCRSHQIAAAHSLASFLHLLFFSLSNLETLNLSIKKYYYSFKKKNEKMSMTNNANTNKSTSSSPSPPFDSAFVCEFLTEFAALQGYDAPLMLSAWTTYAAKKRTLLTYAKMTCAELRAECAGRNMPKTRLKSEMIAALASHDLTIERSQRGPLEFFMDTETGCHVNFDSKMVYDPAQRRVIGVKTDDGTIGLMGEADVAFCKENGLGWDSSRVAYVSCSSILPVAADLTHSDIELDDSDVEV